jgi:hypothetical protein
MAKLVVRLLASICLVLGAVALFISVQGGTVRMGLPTSDATGAEGMIITLPNALPIGVVLLVLSLVFLVASKRFGRVPPDEEQNG